jgi:hypothetical protein
MYYSREARSALGPPNPYGWPLPLQDHSFFLERALIILLAHNSTPHSFAIIALPFCSVAE